MKADFLPTQDGKMSKFLFKVLVFGKSIYTEKYDADLEFKNNVPAEYIFHKVLPRLIPHINVEMNLVF